MKELRGPEGGTQTPGDFFTRHVSLGQNTHVHTHTHTHASGQSECNWGKCENGYTHRTELHLLYTHAHTHTHFFPYPHSMR